jgi:hypothetical protein
MEIGKIAVSTRGAVFARVGRDDDGDMAECGADISGWEPTHPSRYFRYFSDDDMRLDEKIDFFMVGR